MPVSTRAHPQRLSLDSPFLQLPFELRHMIYSMANLPVSVSYKLDDTTFSDRRMRWHGIAKLGQVYCTLRRCLKKPFTRVSRSTGPTVDFPHATNLRAYDEWCDSLPGRVADAIHLPRDVFRISRLLREEDKSSILLVFSKVLIRARRTISSGDSVHLSLYRGYPGRCICDAIRAMEAVILKWDEVVFPDFSGLNLLMLNKEINDEFSCYIAENVGHHIEAQHYIDCGKTNTDYWEHGIRITSVKKCWITINEEVDQQGEDLRELEFLLKRMPNMQQLSVSIRKTRHLTGTTVMKALWKRRILAAMLRLQRFEITFKDQTFGARYELEKSQDVNKKEIWERRISHHPSTAVEEDSVMPMWETYNFK